MTMQQEGGQLLIRGDLLIDGRGRAPLAGGAVLIENGRIAAVGKAGDFGTGEKIPVLDCLGQTLLPGLIDCHNHLSLDPRLEDYLHRMADPVPALTLRAVETMKIDLRAGVTTSRCMGDKGFLDVACKKAVEEGRIEGPRLLVATRGIRAHHGHGFVGYPFSGADQIRDAVRENVLAGADLIKLYITGTLKGDRGLPSYFSPEEIRTAVEEAHRMGLAVATHCIGGIGFAWALEAGIDVIEHGYFLTDADIELFARTPGRWLVLTPSIFFTDERIRTLPKNLVEGHLRQRDEVRQRMEAVVRAGVPFAAGTDAMHGGLAREVQYLVEFGATPARALAAATIDAARVCGLDREIGTIEPGKSADLIGVRGNPLADVGAFGRVGAVVCRGRIKHHEGG